jgi:hypothetical protein
VDAPWSGSSQSAQLHLSRALNRFDPSGRLSLIVADIDESHELHSIPDLLPIGGAGETAWVNRGKVIGASRVGENARLYTSQLVRQCSPHPVVPAWPRDVIQLAKALLAGEDCRLPLSDAIEEGGDCELAEHFRTEPQHPCTCFGFDMILRGES